MKTYQIRTLTRDGFKCRQCQSPASSVWTCWHTVPEFAPECALVTLCEPCRNTHPDIIDYKRLKRDPSHPATQLTLWGAL